MTTQIGNWGGRKKIAYATFAILIVCFIAIFVWFLSLASMPKLIIPVNAMPTPNAFDTFNEAMAALMDSKKIDYASNATHSGKTPEDRAYTLKEREELVTENEPVLSIFREGMKQECMAPNIRSIFTLQPYLAKYRKLTRLLILDSHLRAEKGDWNGAVQRRLDAIEFGNKILTGGALMHSLVGSACESLGQRGISPLFEMLSTAQAKSALTRLEKIDRETYPLSETLEEEKRSGQAQILEVYRKIRAYKDIVELNNLSSGNPIDNNRKVLEYVLMDKRGAIKTYARYMDSIIAISKQPYSARSPLPIVPKDCVNQLLDSDPSTFSTSIYSSKSLTTANKMLRLGLALKIYKDEHGKYPTSFSELVPGIISKVPDDPFALTGTFKYRLEKDKYVLYSVGPDGIDDGGMPIDDKRQISPGNPKSTARYTPKEDSKGDILLGTNVQ